MRIIIDAMGGDNAPGEIVKGAAEAQRALGVDITLVGREGEVRACLAQCGAAENEHIAVKNAEEVVSMHDDPSTVLRTKRDSSMAVALKMLHDGEGDACLSAGSTGALLTGATLTVKRIPGIRRAAMAPVMQNGEYGTILIDCGANAECTEEYLLQFAYMGSFYSNKILGCPSPRVGLLNIGAEDTKGTALQKNTYALLQGAHEAGRINFIGNVEGHDMFSGRAEVIVADGFSGNVMLKTIEGTAKFLMKNIKGAFTSGLRGKMAALLVKDEMRAVKKLLDPSEVGGTPMLGISKPVIKAHGSSDARAIENAVRQAKTFAESGITELIAENIEFMKLRGDTKA